MRHASRSLGRAATLLTAPLIAGIFGAASPSGATTSDKPTDRASLSCAGQTVDPQAKIRHRTEILIKAPLHRVWRVQTDVARWPAWQNAVTTNKRLDHGPLRSGSSFRWTTPAPETPISPATTLTITSTVQQLKTHQCIRWTGPAVGKGVKIDRGVHVWTFTRTPKGILVRTDETWTGPQPERDIPTATHMLGAGLEMWLKDLKTAAESPHPCPR